MADHNWDLTPERTKEYVKKDRTYNYKLGKYRQDILTRLSKGESMASIARLYGCSYQAIQHIKAIHGKA